MIPAFNASCTIAETLNSVRACFNSDSRVEVIVVNDGSDDGTSRLARTWAGQFSSFHVIDQKKQGVAEARNNGVRASRGAWIYFLDADDLMSTAVGSQLLRLLDAHDRTGPAWFSFAFTKFIERAQVLEPHQSSIEFEVIDFFSLNPLKFPICVGSVVVRRDALMATGLFNSGETIGEDLELWAKLGAMYPLHHCRAVLLHYRQKPGQGVTSREHGYCKIFPAIRWLLSLRGWTENQAAFVGSYGILNLYVLKRSGISGNGALMNELIRRVGRISQRQSCRLVFFRLMPLSAFDLIRKLRRFTPAPLVITSDAIARSIVFRFLLRDCRIVSPSNAHSWLPEGPSSHLDSSWRAWPNFAAGFVTKDRVRKYATWSGVEVAEAECILTHRLVRGYARIFDKLQSLSIGETAPIVVALPGDREILRQISLCASSGQSKFRPSMGVSLTSVVSGLYSTIQDGLRVGNACLKTFRFSWSAWSRGLSRRDSQGGWDILFLGHRQSIVTDPDKLSEFCFWADVRAHVSSGPASESVKIVLLSGVKSANIAKVPGIIVVPDLLSLPVVLGLRDVVELLFSTGRIFFSTSLFLTGGEMADEIMATTSAMALKKGGFRIVFSTNTNYQGDPVIEAVRKCRIPRANLYYSTNNRLLQAKNSPAPVDNPAWKMSGDAVHFSWNDSMDAWLQHGIGISPEKIIRSGPLMFASTNAIQKSADPSWSHCGDIAGRATVGIFDITPVTVSRGFDLGLGRTGYPQEICLQFFRDTLEAAHEVFGNRVRFLVKFKREINPAAHDRDYVAELSRLLDPLGDRVVRLPADANPWTAMALSNYVVGMAFTSMVDAATWLGLPAAYYFPDLSLEEQTGRAAPFFMGKAGLRDWFSSTQPRQVEVKDAASIAAWHVARFIESQVLSRQNSPPVVL